MATQDFFPAASWRRKAERKEFWQVGQSVSYVHPAGPQQALIAVISTSSLVGQQGQLSEGFLITNFCFLHLIGDEIN